MKIDLPDHMVKDVRELEAKYFEFIAGYIVICLYQECEFLYISDSAGRMDETLKVFENYISIENRLQITEQWKNSILYSKGDPTVSS